MDDPKKTVGRATAILRELNALKRDARTGGSAAVERFEQAALARLPEMMRLLGEACGIEVPT